MEEIENEGFYGEDYVEEQTKSKYLKIRPGETIKFRILSKPLQLWLYWAGGKPYRSRISDGKPINVSEAEIKLAEVFTIFNYNENTMQIFEVTQRSIKNRIRELVKDEAWANPFEYDMSLTRTGDGMNTKYSINPSPPNPVTDEVKQAYKETPIDLEALFDGNDPFEQQLNF